MARRPPALHLSAPALVTTLHLLTLCELTVALARRRSPPALPKGPGGAPPCELLFVAAVLEAIRRRIIGAKDLIIGSAPLKAWRKDDPDAATGHAPPHHPTRFLRGYRVHTMLCRGSGLPRLFLLAPAVHRLVRCRRPRRPHLRGRGHRRARCGRRWPPGPHPLPQTRPRPHLGGPRLS